MASGRSAPTDRAAAAHRRRHATASSLLPALLVGVALLVIALTGRAGPVTARIALDHGRVRSGGVITGRLILDNATPVRRVLLRGCVTNGRFEVGLRAADGYTQGGFFSLVGCSPLQVLVAAGPGVTSYPFKLRATYAGCLQSAKGQPPKGSPYWMPLCLRDSRGVRDIAPPLPAGQYTAVFIPDGNWHGPRVKPASLVVTGPS